MINVSISQSFDKSAHQIVNSKLNKKCESVARSIKFD